MKLLIIGKDGQLSTELARQAKARTDIEVVGQLGIDAVDLSRPESGAEAIAAVEADIIINATAFTAVDKAEELPELAAKINAEGPALMAEAAAAKGIPFLHVSTDYVFDGTGETPWQENDATGPLGVYGATKLDGEAGVQAARGPHAILRTSWVFSAHGSNFVKTMLRLSDSRDSLNVVADQIGGPTPASAIAQACLTIADHLATDIGKSGTYHFSGAPDTSWHDFATEISGQASRTIKVTPILTENYPTPAKRPLNSRLDCRSTEDVFGLKRPDWRHDLTEVLSQLEIQK